MKENKDLAEEVTEFGEHLIQGKFIYFLLVGGKDYPG